MHAENMSRSFVLAVVANQPMFHCLMLA